jgi:alpha-L-rhamnosidase
MAVSIDQLSFEHHREPLGIGESSPRISWRFGSNAAPAVNWLQSSYDLEILQGPSSEAESFSFDSPESILVPWPAEPLGSGEAAQVRVRAHGQPGQPSTDWSDYVSVEAGLLSPEDWQGAVPISADREFNISEPKQPLYFRQVFTSAANVTKARLYITALGVYEAEINGNRIGDHVFAPGWQSYDHRHVYDTYDVTDLLHSETNVMSILVGEGWYAGRLGYGGGARNIYGDTIGPMALLALTHDDGSTSFVPTDTTWQATTGPILASEIYNGERYDSSLELGNFSSIDYDSSDWSGTVALPLPKGQLVSPDGPPVRRLEELPVRDMFLSESGKQILDFGQNLVGWLKVTVDGPAGTNITIVHTEVLENGEVATRPLRGAKATDTLLLSGNGSVTWEPKFTFHGFRYVQVTGWPEDVPLDATSIVAVVIHSDLERTGYFECSNPLLNKFEENVVWSMKGNFLSIPTDCPQRDERLGWTGDIHAFGPTANYLYNTAGFLRSWHRDLWAEQQINGSMIVPIVIPAVPATGLGGPPMAAAVWGDVSVGGPWNLYRFFGDIEMLREQYPSASSWVDTGILRDPSTGTPGLWNRTNFQFGDWLDPKSPPSAPGNATTHRVLVADAYLVRMTELLANMSTYLNLPNEATTYTSQHSSLLSSFSSAWLTSPDGLPANITQTALTLALRFNLFGPNSSSSTTTSTAQTTLRSLVADNNYHVGTGFAATSHLPFVLSSISPAGAQDMYRMLLQTSVPSWLYQVVMGATTTWERWDSLLENGTVNPGEMTSFNHYAFGSVADWVHATVGGLSPEEPGWSVVRVEPVPGGGLSWARGRVRTGYGEVRCEWWVEDGRGDGGSGDGDGEGQMVLNGSGRRGKGLYLQVRVPPNSKALVTVPGRNETVMVGSGFYEWFVEDFEVPE